jgi:hypothetical protein
VISKRSITDNPNLFLAIRQLLTAYSVAVRRGTGFPVIHGVLEALFTDDPEQLQDALRMWKAPVLAASTVAAHARTAAQENQVAVGSSNSPYQSKSVRAESSKTSVIVSRTLIAFMERWGNPLRY